VSALANLRPDHDIQWMTVNCVGGEPGLKRPACAIIINTLLTHRPLCAFCCSQCSTHMRISKIDNAETKTKTRINFDNRLFDYRLTSLAISEASIYLSRSLYLAHKKHGPNGRCDMQPSPLTVNIVWFAVFKLTWAWDRRIERVQHIMQPPTAGLHKQTRYYPWFQASFCSN